MKTSDSFVLRNLQRISIQCNNKVFDPRTFHGYHGKVGGDPTMAQAYEAKQMRSTEQPSGLKAEIGNINHFSPIKVVVVPCSGS